MIDGLLHALRQPEYLHTLLNPLPVYGLSIATIGLIIALIFRSRSAQITTLALIFICAAAAWPVVHYGEQAFDQMLTSVDDDGRAWLEDHADRAEKLIYLFYGLAAVSALAMAAPKKWPRTAQPLALATVLLALVSLGAGANIAYAGGKIRHREFRTVPPPTKDSESDAAR